VKNTRAAGLDLLKGRKVKFVITSEYGLVRHTTRSSEMYRTLTTFHGRGYSARCFLEVAIGSVERSERATRFAARSCGYSGN
jgi:hypothetical protein